MSAHPNILAAVALGEDNLRRLTLMVCYARQAQYMIRPSTFFHPHANPAEAARYAALAAHYARLVMEDAAP